MSDQPEPAGKWTVKQVGIEYWAVYEGNQLIGNAWDKMEAESISHCHNAALAAEREKVQALVDEGNKMRRTMYSNDSEESKAWDAALEKVKK